jgi:uncharacterized protein YqeY
MTTSNDSSLTIIDRLRIDLLEARKERNQLIVSTLQAVISAIDNASAVPASESIGTLGVGSTEAPRRELSKQDIEEIIENEIIELQHAIAQFEGAKTPYVDELGSKINILEKYL